MFGHPLHPALVHFPLGLLLSATIADLARVAGLTTNVQIAAVLMAAGLLAALLAMGAGMVDFARLEEAVVPHAMRHMGAVGLAWLVYAAALYFRRDLFTGGATVAHARVILSVIGAALLALGGFFGGRLVYEFGAGDSKRSA